MSAEIATLRSPSELEALFYRELLGPLKEFTASRLSDPAGIHEAQLSAQRFRKDIARYGYVLTVWGPMLRVEPDPLDTELDPARKARVDTDMLIMHRLRTK